MGMGAWHSIRKTHSPVRPRPETSTVCGHPTQIGAPRSVGEGRRPTLDDRPKFSTEIRRPTKFGEISPRADRRTLTDLDDLDEPRDEDSV